MDKEPEDLLRYALQEVTRKERRTLLGVASIGILIAWAKVRLSGISVLGLTIQGTSEDWLLFMLGLVVAYFLIAFIVYAVFDLVSWRFSVADKRSRNAADKYQHELEQQKKSKEEREDLANCLKTRVDLAAHERNMDRYKIVRAAKEKRQSYYRPAFIVLLLRVGFDFVLPLIWGGYAVRLLIFS